MSITIIQPDPKDRFKTMMNAFFDCFPHNKNKTKEERESITESYYISLERIFSTLSEEGIKLLIRDICLNEQWFPQVKVVSKYATKYVLRYNPKPDTSKEREKEILAENKVDLMNYNFHSEEEVKNVLTWLVNKLASNKEKEISKELVDKFVSEYWLVFKYFQKDDFKIVLEKLKLKTSICFKNILQETIDINHEIRNVRFAELVDMGLKDLPFQVEPTDSVCNQWSKILKSWQSNDPFLMQSLY